MDLEYSTLILTKEEVSFLAGALGIKSLYGILSVDKAPREQDLFRILKTLMAKEFISCQEDSYVIDTQVRKIIEFMRDAKEHKVYGGNDSIRPVKCVYFTDGRALVCEQSYVSENELHFFELSDKELLELLRDEGYSEEELDDTD